MRLTWNDRLREYAFLLAATLAAAAYGVIHDQITATISTDYFLVAKGLQHDSRPYRLAVTALALKSSGWVGLALGTALLVANNPSARWPRLPYATLLRIAALPLAVAALGACLGGALLPVLDLGQVPAAVAMAGARGASRFLVVWGAHGGSYLGALAGGVAAVAVVLARRRAAARLDVARDPA